MPDFSSMMSGEWQLEACDYSCIFYGIMSRESTGSFAQALDFFFKGSGRSLCYGFFFFLEKQHNIRKIYKISYALKK